MSSMRSIANTTITLGLLSIPVKMYISAAPEKVSFKWISPKGNAVKQKLFDGETNEEMQHKDIKLGYEAGDATVLFTDDELDLITCEKKNVIEIIECTDAANISPLTVERALYLAPDKSDKAFLLLHHALTETKKTAIAKWYCKGRDNLLALAVIGPHIVAHQMYYSGEIREVAASYAKNAEPSPEDVKLASALIEKMTNANYDLNAFKDEYKTRLEAAVELKLKGKNVGERALNNVTKSTSLTSKLEKSIKKVKE